MENNESGIVFIPQIPKTPQRKEGDRIFKRYERLHLYLGLLAGLTLLRPNKTFMKDFVDHLNSLYNSGEIGNIFIEAVRKLSLELNRSIREMIGINDYLLLTETPFTPTNTQIERTKRFIQLNSEGTGNKDRMELLQKIISNEIEELELPSGKKISTKNLFNSSNLLTDLNDKDRKFLEELKDAVGYYYYDFSHYGSNLEVRRAISLATARIDGLFLINLERCGYNMAEIANLFNRFTLSPTNFNRKETELLGRLIKDIFSGKVRFVFLEIKSRFFKDGKRNDYNERDIEDVAHSILSMFEFLTTAARIRGFQFDPQFSFLFQIMNHNYKERLIALFRSREFLRIMRNNFFCLAFLNWPILEVSEEEKINLDHKLIKETKPNLKIEIISLKNLLREVKRRASKMFLDIKATQH